MREIQSEVWDGMSNGQFGARVVKHVSGPVMSELARRGVSTTVDDSRMMRVAIALLAEGDEMFVDECFEREGRLFLSQEVRGTFITAVCDELLKV